MLWRATQGVVICYSSPKKLIQLASPPVLSYLTTLATIGKKGNILMLHLLIWLSYFLPDSKPRQEEELN